METKTKIKTKAEFIKDYTAEQDAAVASGSRRRTDHPYHMLKHWLGVKQKVFMKRRALDAELRLQPVQPGKQSELLSEEERIEKDAQILIGGEYLKAIKRALEQIDQIERRYEEEWGEECDAAWEAYRKEHATPTPIKAIETKYKGYRFRSRLEARWAVFFDKLGIKWEYEPEGYDLDGARYLPDFWLPEQQCWIEIKAKEPTDAESEKARRLSKMSDHPVYVFWGNIAAPDLGRNAGTGSAWEYHAGGWDHGYLWCECPYCHALGIQFEGRSARLSCGCVKARDKFNDRVHAPDTPRLLAAYEAARSARFEHGEKP